MRHHVNGRIIPGNQFPIVPDIFRLLDRHCGNSFSYGFRSS
jgi:hypothetical protein